MKTGELTPMEEKRARERGGEVLHERVWWMNVGVVNNEVQDESRRKEEQESGASKWTIRDLSIGAPHGSSQAFGPSGLGHGPKIGVLGRGSVGIS